MAIAVGLSPNSFTILSIIPTVTDVLQGRNTVYLCLVLIIGLLFYANKVGHLSDWRHMGIPKQVSKESSGPPKTLTLSTQERIELLANVILDKILLEKKLVEKAKSSKERG